LARRRKSRSHRLLRGALEGLLADIALDRLGRLELRQLGDGDGYSNSAVHLRKSARCVETTALRRSDTCSNARVGSEQHGSQCSDSGSVSPSTHRVRLELGRRTLASPVLLGHLALVLRLCALRGVSGEYLRAKRSGDQEELVAIV
jgi:hypothetical protein